jgi:aminomethyltransferase
MLKTACHDWHVAHRGRMVDFAGWDMPVQYSTITEEHQAVRTAAGLFDIAHMGRLRLTGPDAARFLDHLLTRSVATLRTGQVRYALVTNEQGGILDDVLAYRFAGFHLLVVNASNRVKIVDWIDQHRRGFDVTVEDLTFDWFMLALQGPRSLEILAPLVERDIGALKYYWGTETKVSGVPGIVTRTGYSGEDGFEVILPAERGLALWENIVASGSAVGLLPAGLGCRDTLRFEAAMPLYGHEMDETVDPFTAGLGFGVNLDKETEFVGQAALRAAARRTDRLQRVGLELEGRRIAREGALLFSGSNQVGRVTSGTFSPTLQKSIAMGYVPAKTAQPGTLLDVDIRGKREPARVVELPFYKRAK